MVKPAQTAAKPAKNAFDALTEKIKKTGNPSAVGLDTDFGYLPEDMRGGARNLEDAAKAVTEFNYRLIDRLYKIIPCVKLQSAYYEAYGRAGVNAFYDTAAYARDKGLAVIADVKRNDIGSTAAAYSAAYLGRTEVNGNAFSAFPCDFATVNAYLGEDGVKPFIADCVKYGKGIFVLVKTSNKSSGQFQDKEYANGVPLYAAVAEAVNAWGKDSTGASGFSAVGAVVGATYPKQAAILRETMPNAFFLVPGYGAQGASAQDLKPCFKPDGGGAVVNSSRAILCAYKSDKYKGLNFADAAYNAACEMREDIVNVLK